jgi:hypothetical protein
MAAKQMMAWAMVALQSLAVDCGSPIVLLQLRADAVEKKTTEKDIIVTVGSHESPAELTEAGYSEVANMHDDAEMTSFVRKLVKTLGLVVTNEGELQGFVPWFSGSKAVQNFQDMHDELLLKDWIEGDKENAAAMDLLKLNAPPIKLNTEDTVTSVEKDGVDAMDLGELNASDTNLSKAEAAVFGDEENASPVGLSELNTSDANLSNVDTAVVGEKGNASALGLSELNASDANLSNVETAVVGERENSPAMGQIKLSAHAINTSTVRAAPSNSSAKFYRRAKTHLDAVVMRVKQRKSLAWLASEVGMHANKETRGLSRRTGMTIIALRDLFDMKPEDRVRLLKGLQKQNVIVQQLDGSRHVEVADQLATRLFDAQGHRQTSEQLKERSKPHMA